MCVGLIGGAHDVPDARGVVFSPPNRRPVCTPKLPSAPREPGRLGPVVKPKFRPVDGEEGDAFNGDAVGDTGPLKLYTVAVRTRDARGGSHGP